MTSISPNSSSSMYSKYLFRLLVCISLLNGACTKDSTTTESNTTSFTVSSTAFDNAGSFPKKYTCDSLGISPTLSWKNAPAGTNSYAVTMHHIPTVGDKHVYLLLYNIPASVTSIPEAVSGIGLFGINTVNGQTKYTPPCSQGPGAKTYILTVYALSAAPTFNVPQSQVTMDLLLTAIMGKTLSSATVNVTYTRP